MVGPLQAAVDAGIKVITVDTFLGDGDYVNGPVTFPISYIGSDNVEGGRISARGLAEAIGGKGKVYINSTNPNVSSVEGREQGFAEVMKNEFPDITVLGPDYNLDDQNNAAQQTAAVLEREPGSRRRLRHQRVQRPGRRQGGGQRRPRRPRPGRRLRRDQGRHRVDEQGRRLAGAGAEALRHGLHGGAVRRRRRRRRHQPAARVETGFAIIDKDNVADPEIARFIYQVPGELTAARRRERPSRRSRLSHPAREGDRVTALDRQPVRGSRTAGASASSSPFSRLWAWVFLGLMIVFFVIAVPLASGGASASSPSATRRTSSSPSPRSCCSGSGRPSSSSPPASISRSAG